MVNIRSKLSRFNEIPDWGDDYFIPTLNQMGVMTTTIDPFTEAFINFAALQSYPVLDIGAAYGIATLAALERGATVIANDIEPRHLYILKKMVDEKLQARLLTIEGEFPNSLNLKDNSISAVLISRVLHFFDGKKTELSLQKILSWLIPGGKLYIITESPFQQHLIDNLPMIEKQIQEGKQYPGVISPVKADPALKANTPKMFHFFTPESLRDLLMKFNFILEKVDYIPRPEYPDYARFDGRESVGAIALKPMD